MNFGSSCSSYSFDYLDAYPSSIFASWRERKWCSLAVDVPMIADDSAVEIDIGESISEKFRREALLSF